MTGKEEIEKRIEYLKQQIQQVERLMKKFSEGGVQVKRDLEEKRKEYLKTIETLKKENQ